MFFDQIITELTSEQFETLCAKLSNNTYPHNYLLIDNPDGFFKIDKRRANPEDFKKLMTSLSQCKKVTTLSVDLVDFGIEMVSNRDFFFFEKTTETAMALFADIIETQLSSLELSGYWQCTLSNLGFKNPLEPALDAIMASDKLRCLKLFFREYIVHCASKIGEIIRKNTLEELTIDGIVFYRGKYIYATCWKPLLDAIQANTSLNRLEIINYTGERSDDGTTFLHDLVIALLGKPALRAVNLSSSMLSTSSPTWTLWGKPSFPLMQLLKHSNIVDFGFRFTSPNVGVQEPKKEEIQAILNQNKARLAEEAKGALFDGMHEIFRKNQHLLSLYESKVISNDIFSFAGFPENPVEPCQWRLASRSLHGI